MSAAIWLQRARRWPLVLLLLAAVAAPIAWWRDLAHMQRTRRVWTDIEDLMGQEYRLRQDLQSLEFVRHLHEDAAVRQRAEARQAEVERNLRQMVAERRALQQYARQTFDGKQAL
jgi:hypothetical protein